MKVTKTGTTVDLLIEGSVGEGASIFNTDLRDATKITMNLEKLTYINSVGVKAWINWLLPVKPTTPVVIQNAPIVIVNQASTVSGFLPKHAEIDSFIAPFVCPKCDAEANSLVERKKDYDYATRTTQAFLKLRPVYCPKCRGEMEGDFMPAKVFAFLSLRPPT